jgi:hypothetical protein
MQPNEAAHLHQIAQDSVLQIEDHREQSQQTVDRFEGYIEGDSKDHSAQKLNYQTGEPESN